MFSGIVEEKATVIAIEHDRDNVHFTLDCSFKDELKIEDKGYTVTAMKETLDRSNLGEWKVGTKVNVERSMKMNGRLDGHIVQGHVDLTAVCTGIEDNNGSWYFTFEYESGKEMAKRGYLTVDKGSVTVNGVSLTVCDPTDRSFKVSIIPYTYENTDFGELRPGMKVNIEFDIIGKYVARMLDYGVLEKYSGL